MTPNPAVLVLNCGSSSIKYELVEPIEGRRLARGQIERIGDSATRHQHSALDDEIERPIEAADHSEAMSHVLAAFDQHGPDLESTDLVGVGHRVVMGGVEFSAPTMIDDAVEAAVERLSSLAPLHNPANLAGIRAARTAMPSVPQVAVFDTAFFGDLPEEATTYAIDRTVAAEHGIRRYGFHGTSHQYVSSRVAALTGRDDLRQVILHLGNGASAAAVVSGRPVATTMGLTPLQGLVMGTRSGDVDPAIVLYLQREAGMTIDDVDELLNRHSGLSGMSGHSDLRDVHAAAAAGDDASQLALDVYVRRIKHYVGAYAAIMGGIDALTFTAGVGENDPVIRARVVDGLAFLGMTIDPALNQSTLGREQFISVDDGEARVLVVPTDEELAIARQTLDVLD